MDQDAINLAKAIRQKESGGNFDAVGDNGTSRGAYQWQAGTWKAHAKQVLGDENAPMTRDNQQAVAYGVIKSWKDQGLNPAQIAAKWNSGSEKGWENKIGTTTINGKTIAYNVPQYVKDVTDTYHTFKAQTQPQVLQEIPAPEMSSQVSGTGENTLSNIGVGIGSSLGKFALGIPQAVLKVSQGVSNFVAPLMGQQPVDYSPAISKIEEVKQGVFQKPFENQLDTTSGKFGEVVGNIVPYATGSGEIASAANASTRLFQGAGALNAAGRVLAGATTEGLANAGIAYAGSGGDTKEALTAGLTAGALKGAFSGAGELANKIKLPETISGPVFKMSKEEAKQVFKNENVDTVNSWAVRNGLKGNTEQLAKQVGAILDDSEQKIFQEFEKKGFPTITVEDPEKFISAVRQKALLLEKSGAKNEARNLLSSLGSINAETGEMSAGAALSLRRYLDGLRIEKSFFTPTEELSAQQAGLREMTDELRHKINAIGATKDIMQNYSKAIQAMEILVKRAKSENNSQALDFASNLFLGGSIGFQSPELAAAALARKAFNTTKGRTTTAQALKNLPQSSKTGATVRSATGQAAVSIQQ